MEISYENIYENSINKTIYQNPAYIEMLAQTLEVQKAHLLCGNHNVAIPFLVQSTSFGIIYNSLPFFGSCGGLIGSENLCAELKIELKSVMRKSDFASINIISNWSNPFDFDGEIRDFQRIQRINTKKDLGVIRKENRKLLDTYHPKTRNLSKLAMKQGFQLVDLSQDLDQVTKLHFSENQRRNRRPKPIQMWEYLFRNSDSRLEYVVHGAMIDNEIEGFILFLFDSTTKQVEYYIPNSTEQGRAKNVNYFLLHSSLTEFLMNGFEVFNFGGSLANQSDLLRFKTRWGGESNPYFYYNSYSKLVGLLSEQDIRNATPYFFVRPF